MRTDYWSPTNGIGRSTMGLDCSALASNYLINLFGQDIPRNAKTERIEKIIKTLHQLERGCVVFGKDMLG